MYFLSLKVSKKKNHKFIEIMISDLDPPPSFDDVSIVNDARAADKVFVRNYPSSWTALDLWRLLQTIDDVRAIKLCGTAPRHFAFAVCERRARFLERVAAMQMVRVRVAAFGVVF